MGSATADWGKRRDPARRAALEEFIVGGSRRFRWIRGQAVCAGPARLIEGRAEVKLSTSEPTGGHSLSRRSSCSATPPFDFRSLIVQRDAAGRTVVSHPCPGCGAVGRAARAAAGPSGLSKSRRAGVGPHVRRSTWASFGLLFPQQSCPYYDSAPARSPLVLCAALPYFLALAGRSPLHRMPRATEYCCASTDSTWILAVEYASV
jgi:hypothetical protein